MPAPTKRYFNPNNPHTPVLYNGHQVIPLPALQGLLRALISHWKAPANEKIKLEELLLPTVLSFSDPRLIRRCEEDASPHYQASVAHAAAYVEHNIANILKPCHRALLQGHAQFIDDLLDPFFIKVKTTRNEANRGIILCEYLKQHQTRLLKSVACSRPHPQASSLPPDKAICAWGRCATRARLRNTILAYYHGLKSAQYVGQLLAGRTD